MIRFNEDQEEWQTLSVIALEGGNSVFLENRLLIQAQQYLFCLPLIGIFAVYDLKDPAKPVLVPLTESESISHKTSKSSVLSLGSLFSGIRSITQKMGITSPVKAKDASFGDYNSIDLCRVQTVPGLNDETLTVIMVISERLETTTCVYKLELAMCAASYRLVEKTVIHEGLNERLEGLSLAASSAKDGEITLVWESLQSTHSLAGVVRHKSLLLEVESASKVYTESLDSQETLVIYDNGKIVSHYTQSTGVRVLKDLNIRVELVQKIASQLYLISTLKELYVITIEASTKKHNVSQTTLLAEFNTLVFRTVSLF